MRTLTAYSAEDTGAARLEASGAGVSAFVDARYGLSVHCGLYALLGRGRSAISTRKNKAS